MPTTKTGIGYPIGLPKAVMDVLRWHVETQFEEGPAKESGLLFPSQEGTMRFVAAWDKPMKKAAKAAGIQKKISPKAMRRTHRDLARAASRAS